MRDVGGAYLIRSVANAHVEIWKLGLHHVSQNDIQTFLGRGRLKAFGHLGGHTRIQFHRDHLLGLFHNLSRQVTGSGTNFKDDLEIDNQSVYAGWSRGVVAATHIALFELCLVDYAFVNRQPMSHPERPRGKIR